MNMAPQLPVPVLDRPRWRVNIRPVEFTPERIPQISECFRIVEQSKVRLRGWDYPHVSQRGAQQAVGTDWVASWADNLGHIEYWRFYQSGQFIHLFAIREAVDKQWEEKLRDAMRWHLGGEDRGLESARGFISFESFIYTVTEIFEFAARLAEKGLYEEGLKVSIELLDAQLFALTPGVERAWSEFKALSSPEVGREWSISPADLLAATSEFSLAAIVWFFERFGWMAPNVEAIKREQSKFLRKAL